MKHPKRSFAESLLRRKRRERQHETAVDLAMQQNPHFRQRREAAEAGSHERATAREIASRIEAPTLAGDPMGGASAVALAAGSRGKRRPV